MNKIDARKLVEDTLQNSFDKDKFCRFIRELLNHFEDKPFVYRGKYIREAYAPYIQSLERIGSYQDSDGKKIDILIAKLKKESSLERARTMQRNFIAWYLTSRDPKDAALVAFVAPDSEDWRFSLVEMEYKFAETPTGRPTAKEEFTPARRFSFLVGENETSHTAQSRLVPLIEDDEHNPTLKDLEEAFNIEKATKEFFEKYRELYNRVKETLDKVIKKDKTLKKDFETKGINSVDFSKKLLGQIVFLYFLQKKGWFGVKRGKEWGSGSKHFLRELFEKKHGEYQNFFNDILEPLFYEALRLDRPGDYYHEFDCRIPFLNGGLFDPINDYDWIDTDILLPNELFRNKQKTKEGDEGTGILDIFDRYNFTVKEDEPLEKEVAVDPEMLGKVFENLLEVKDRKSKGTYYTPREIVHYMCQESLANYLATELDGKVSKEDIDTLLKYGETVMEHDSRVVNEGRETKAYSFKLPKSVRDHASLIDEKLESIRVCDPAVGSGAFPVGMMNEIVRTRNALTSYIGTNGERTNYHFKRHAIQECLYGVDIDPSAIEIAKLRLWLSLVVDEEDRRTIQPLPNLDYKIVCGNSLLGYPYEPRWLKKIESLKDDFFLTANPGMKQKLKSQIDSKLIGFLANSEDSLGYKVDFDFKIFFSEVFREKNGFDVVIANPPYIRQEDIKFKKALNHYKVASGTADIYCYFYELAYDILRDAGTITFITSNKYLRANYGKKLRQFLKDHFSFYLLLDFGDLPVFKATAYPSVLIAAKGKDQGAIFEGCSIATVEELDQFEKVLERNCIAMVQEDLPSEDAWNIAKSDIVMLRTKLEGTKVDTKLLKEYVSGKMYYGIKTGFNEAFVINSPTRDKLIAQDSNSREVIKPYLRGKDLKRYGFEDANLYLLFIPWHFPLHHRTDITGASKEAEKAFKLEYPAIYQHLLQFKDKLAQRNKVETGVRYEWYALQRCAASYWQELDKPKIIWGNLSKEPRFALDNSGHYINAPANILVANDHYLLGLLNSSLCGFLISTSAAQRSGGYLEFKPMYVGRIPIRIASESQRSGISNLVMEILNARKHHQDTSALEKQVNQLVYKLYDLTPEEIKIVEGEG